MRNSASTPKRNTVEDESVSKAEISSAKKLKQARLPFKIITPGTPSDSSKTVTTPAVDKDEDAIEDSSTDSRKRKLSSDTDNDRANNVMDEDPNISKENVEVLTAAAKKKKLSAISNNDTMEVVSLLDDDEDNTEYNKDKANSSIRGTGKKDLDAKTTRSSIKDKKKGAGTPQTSSSQKDKSGGATKLQIKLPLSAGKKKRRKSNLSHIFNSSSAESTPNNLTQELSSDGIEEIGTEHNPQKRKKLMESSKTKSTVVLEVEEKETETYDLDSESDQKDETTDTERATKAIIGKNELKKGSEISSKIKTRSHVNVNVELSEVEQPIAKTTSVKLSSNADGVQNIDISNSSDENEEQNDDILDNEEIVLSDNEADDETDNLASKSTNISSDTKSNKATTERINNEKNLGSSSKTLTPKQVKLMDQRRKAREEKERKLQEEKMKKQQEKEEKEMVRKREREEKEENKRKEREEKEEQKRKEREEKERKRLADIEAKNEEKRKKHEAKGEELRKKEEERKRKEQEKEEAELKKKKAAQAFTRFFVAKTPSNVQLKNEDDSNTYDGTKYLAFRPFQIKGDMKLAPILRKHFTAERKTRLDNLLAYTNKTDAEKSDDEADEEIMRRKPLPKSQLYLSEIRSGIVLPGKWRRPSTESKDDVIFVEDELERVGQAIVEDTPAYVREEMRVKFYKFHDNRRPPYYGTWRKKSAVVGPRKPFAQDKKYFDYEVDSDDEWEEEEPGESLEDGSDEDKEKESEDDDYEVDNEWFVPHGHLSDEELQNEDELGMGNDNTREAQKVKLQLLQQEFAQEMKKKTEKIKPRLIGCIWTDINGNQPSQCAKILWDTLEKKAMLFTDLPLVEEPEADRSSEINSPSTASNGNTEKTTDKLKPISISDNMVKDLTRLIHGNNHSKNFLINEYIAYIEKTEESVKSGGLRGPLKSMVRDKIDEIAEWQAIDASASSVQEIEQANEEEPNEKKKKKVKRRLCWVVKQEMLDKMDLSSLKLKNSWKYTLVPKFVKPEKDVVTTIESISSSAEVHGNPAISQISKPPKERIKKRENKTSSNEAGTAAKSNTVVTSKEKKRVPLLISVARDQQISTPAKNKLISQFLKQKNNDSVKTSAPTIPVRRSNAATSPTIEDDDVLID